MLPVSITEEQKLIAQIELIESIEHKDENVFADNQFNTWQIILDQKKKRLSEIQQSKK